MEKCSVFPISVSKMVENMIRYELMCSVVADENTFYSEMFFLVFELQGLTSILEMTKCLLSMSQNYNRHRLLIFICFFFCLFCTCPSRLKHFSSLTPNNRLTPLIDIEKACTLNPNIHHIQHGPL